MAAFLNERDKRLQATSPRTETVALPDNFVYNGDVSGNVSGTVNFVGAGTISLGAGHGNAINSGTGSIGGGTNIDGLIASLVSVGADRGNDMFNGVGAIGSGTTIGGLVQTALQNSQITLSSGGSLLGAGGGQITNLPYSNTTGGPPASATTNFFTRSGSNPSGGSDGDAHWNTSTLTMWFKTGGVWSVGGTINANQITVGTLAAARIAANSISADKINVGVASDITTNLGTFTTGLISGNASIDLTGRAVFNGSYTSGGTNAAGHFNGSLNAIYGVAGGSANGSGAGVLGQGFGSGQGVRAVSSGSGAALSVVGRMIINNSTLVSNLRAQTCVTADSANFVSGSNVSGTVASAANASNATNASNSSSLGGVGASGWCRGVVCNVGTATAQGFGFGFISTVSGVETAATGANNYRVRSISDRRRKFNIKDLPIGFDFLHDLKPRIGRYKDQPNLDRMFLIAQEVEQVEVAHGQLVGCLSVTHEDGYKGLDYIGLTVLLLKNLCDAEKRVSSSESRISKLETQVKKLAESVLKLTDSAKPQTI